MEVIKVEYIDRFNYKKYIGKDVVVNGNVNLTSLGLTELPNINFISVKETFDCSCNKLKNLKNSPRKVGNFWAFKNKLESLEGDPIFVGGNFSCNCNKLKSLDGCSTEYIGGAFYCHHNNLKSFDCNFKYLGGGIQFFTEDLALKYKINIINERFKKLKVLYNSQKCKFHI